MPEGSPRSIGLVLSGGGTRLFAHIGFLWALDDAGLLAPGEVPLAAVVGNSAGSVVGAMFALGYTPREMWETAFWRVWGYCPPQEPRAWRQDPRPRGLEVALDPDLDGLARALAENLSYFKGVDTGLRFEALLRRILEREEPGGEPNPCFVGSRPPAGRLPLYLIGFNLSNRRETIFHFRAHCPPTAACAPEVVETARGRELSYELCSDVADPGTPDNERFRPWEAVRISTSLPVIFHPYFKPRFVATHWDDEGQPFRLVQGAYLSDGGSRDNYSLSAAIKLAGCDAAFGCFLGDLEYPYEEVGTGTLLTVAQRDVDGMMQAIFEADQDDAEIITRPVRTLVPHIAPRPGVTFDLSAIGTVMEAGYIVAAYYLRRLRTDIADDREFLCALVAGEIRLTWSQVFGAGGETWGPPAPEGPPTSDYYIVRTPAEFEALATRFFAEQFPGPPGLAAALPPWDEEIARRNRERREVAPDELASPPFSDMPLATTQRTVVHWAERLSWAAASGIVAGLGSLVLALWAVAGSLLHLVPAPDPAEMWAAELVVLAAAVGIGWWGRRAAVRYAWGELERVIRRSIGFSS